ncbi:20649_t:CDS:2, partial [Cetraspora pellucida]
GDKVFVPFGHAVEKYLNEFDHLKKTCLKKQSLRRVEGAIDYIGWMTKDGYLKSTNHLDDILELTEKGNECISNIQNGNAHDICNCSNFKLKNNVSNEFDMHKCSVRVITKVMLSQIKTEFLMQVILSGSHISSILIPHISTINRINLNYETRDIVIHGRHESNMTTTQIMRNLLAPTNNAPKNELKEILDNKKFACNETKIRHLLERDTRRLRDNIGPWTRLHQLVTNELKNKRVVLYYQQPDSEMQENDYKHYYQLTLSDEIWLQQARDCSSFCFGINGKYDLNNDRAPILVLTVEDQAGYGSPIAIGLSNKENKFTIHIAIETVQKNISYKHQPSKAALEPILRDVILCWFYIMKTFGEHLQNLKVEQSL